jgi:hypothetical protein
MFPAFRSRISLLREEVEAVDPDRGLALVRRSDGAFELLELRTRTRRVLPGARILRESADWHRMRNTSALFSREWVAVAASAEHIHTEARFKTEPANLVVAAWRVDEPSVPMLLHGRAGPRRLLGFVGPTLVILEFASREWQIRAHDTIVGWNLERDRVYGRNDPTKLWAAIHAVRVGAEAVTVLDPFRRPAGLWSRTEGKVIDWETLGVDFDAPEYVFPDGKTALAPWANDHEGPAIVSLSKLEPIVALEPPPWGWERGHLRRSAIHLLEGGRWADSGPVLVAALGDGHEGAPPIGIWRVDDGRFIHGVGPRGNIVTHDPVYASLGSPVCVHPDGRRILLAPQATRGGGVVDRSDDVEVWDLVDARRVQGLDSRVGPVRVLQLSADGRSVIASGDGGDDYESDLLEGVQLWAEGEVPTTTLAYDPHHPLRGDQPLERARVSGSTLAIDHGTLGAWTLGRDKVYATPKLGREALAAKLATWTRRGLALIHDDFELLEQVSARNPALEAEIRAAADPSAAMQVLADWLQAQGDPRGLPNAVALHPSHLLGPLAPWIDEFGLSWQHGLVMSAELVDPPQLAEFGDGPTMLANLLRLPACACLRTLKLSGSWLTHDELVTVLDHRSLDGLRELSLHAPYRQLALVGLRRFEWLERLMSTAWAKLGVVELPRLRELGIHTDFDVEQLIQTLTDSEMPELEMLELGLFGEGSMTEPLLAVLRAPKLARLRRLVIVGNSDSFDEHTAAALADSPAVAELETLDLRRVTQLHDQDQRERIREQLGPRLAGRSVLS